MEKEGDKEKQVFWRRVIIAASFFIILGIFLYCYFPKIATSTYESSFSNQNKECNCGKSNSFSSGQDTSTIINSELNEQHLKEEKKIFEKTGPIGDTYGGTIGPFVALLAAFLTFLAFYIQYLANQQQKDQFTKSLSTQNDERKEQEKVWRIERFEARFFEMVRFHRENVDKMRVDFSKEDNTTYTGQQCFNFIFHQLIDIRNDLRGFFRKKDENFIYLESYRKTLGSEPEIINRGISLKELAKIDICFSIVFYGVDYHGKYLLTQSLYKKYNNDFIKSILDYIALKPIASSKCYPKWKKVKDISDFKKRIIVANKIYSLRNTTSKENESALSTDDIKYFYRDDFIKYYGGHQIRLAHYFRHLFQTVNLVDGQSLLTYNEKYDYIRLLRAQMSTFEQTVFFFNSVSSLGDVWELRSSKNYSHYSFKSKKTDPVNRQLVTKYNLIKNLSDGQLLRMRFTTHYPNVTYEFSDITEERKVLEKLYN